jgi:very-short-patch-repair endonuclease
MAGYRFRRQHAIDRFIVDFYCREASLVVEVDGPVHEKTAAEDRERQTILESQDVIVLRFSNEDVMNRLEGVLQSIRLYLPQKAHSDLDLPSPSKERGRG